MSYDKRIHGYHNYSAGHASRKHKFDRNLFLGIDTQEDAYWLGFFFADGFVKNKGTFGFDLSIKDIEHLERFKIYANTGQPITISRNGKFCRLEISCMDHLSVLSNYGLVQGKSKIIRYPCLADELNQHFIRGVFDGDGWISRRAVIGKTQFGIIGNREFISEIQNVLVSKCELNYTTLAVDKRHKSDWVVSLIYGGRLVIGRIYRYLYQDAIIFLERKHETWKTCL